MLEKKEHSRGFRLYVFKDATDTDCSIQESSLANEAHIWLGTDEPTLHFREVCNTRMYLNREIAKELGEKLIEFAKTGEI